MSNAQRDIRRKQQVLEYAKQSGNVRKTCRHFGIPRSLFYVWRRAVEREGEAGLVNRRPIARSHPKTTRPEIVDQVLHLRRTYHLGPIRIVWYLARYHGVSISDATVYRILCRHGLRRLPNRVGRRAVHIHRYGTVKLLADTLNLCPTCWAQAQTRSPCLGGGCVATLADGGW